MEKPEAVILLHGLVARSWMMLRIAKRLRSEGYRVRNWGYRTLWTSIDQHAADLQVRLSRVFDDASIQRVHFVTHSMGSIIVRRTLLDSQSAKIGRVVMLGPPNRGSHVARKLATRLQRVCPALAELSDAPHSYVNQLPEPQGIEVGVIAAEQDLVVPLGNTRLTNLTDWAMLPGHHSALPWRDTTMEFITSFLTSGTFRCTRLNEHENVDSARSVRRPTADDGR